jgi:hypothetical protein
VGGSHGQPEISNDYGLRNSESSSNQHASLRFYQTSNQFDDGHDGHARKGINGICYDN